MRFRNIKQCAPGSETHVFVPSATPASGPYPGNGRWAIHDIDRDLRVKATREMPELDRDLDLGVERLWLQARARLGERLFNGRVFCAEEIGPDLITGHWTEYRRLIAQFERPELFERLRLRSLAVNGLVIGPDGVVFGRRPERAIYQAGLWQLAPAGSVDPGATAPDGSIDVIRQGAAELREELGISFDAIDDAEPFALVEHAVSHVCDLGIVMRTSLRAADILAAHRHDNDGEYGVLRIVAQADIEVFAAEIGNSMARQSRLFLHRLGWLAADA